MIATEGDWICAKCGMVNQMYRYTCRGCGAPAR